MYNRVLVTEGGPHPAEDWARVTCEDLIPLDGLAATLISSGMILRGRLIEVLADHYKAAQEAERGELRHHADRFIEPLEDVADFARVFAEIQAAASGTAWEGHITGPDVIDAIKQVVTDHARHLRHVERLCHADQHPSEPFGQAYREAHGLPPSPQPPELSTVIALPPPVSEA